MRKNIFNWLRKVFFFKLTLNITKTKRIKAPQIFFQTSLLSLFIFHSFALSISADNKTLKSFISNPQDPEMIELSQPLKLNESLFGCGPTLKQGRIFYVTLSGDDKASGLTEKTAWRTIGTSIKRLTPGDTLMIREGEYVEPNFTVSVSGEQGRPITIMGMPRHRVILTSSLKVPSFTLTKDCLYTFETDLKENPKAAAWIKSVTRSQATAVSGTFEGVWEADTLIELQNEGTIDRTEELPGSFCYDADLGKLYVHFSDSRSSNSHGGVILSEPKGIVVRGRYLCFKNLDFRHYEIGLDVGGGPPISATPAQLAESGHRHLYRGGDHISIEGCSFSMNTRQGLMLTAGARWALIKNNYGIQRGTIQMRGSDMSDNLFLGNRLDSSSPTLRTDGTSTRGISNYGWPGGHVQRYYVINNIINHSSSFLSKAVARVIVFEGNIVHNLNFQGPPDGKRARDERLVVRNNVLLSPPALLATGPGGYKSNWAGPFTASINNFLLPKITSVKDIEEAKFADPAYFDYRLQSDSPLINKALGGGNVGAVRQQKHRVLFVSPKGNDNALGTSISTAWRTLSETSKRLKQGDTLYIMPGKYNDSLEITTSGTIDEPIIVRARNKQTLMPSVTNRSFFTAKANGHEPAVLPQIIIKGSYITVEGLTVVKSQKEGFLIEGSNVTLKHCVSRNNVGAGVVVSGNNLTIIHSTLADNQEGLLIANNVEGTIIRDSLLSNNRDYVIKTETGTNWIGSDNLYFGKGAEKAVSNELRSIVADPLFVDTNKGNYRLRWDSPGAYLGRYAQPAGAIERLVKTPEIENIKALAIGPESAVITWNTPRDDATGMLSYREKGGGSWKNVLTSSREQGTVHAAGIANLKNGTEYECRISATSRRGGKSVSSITTFTTTTKFSQPATYYISTAGDDNSDGLTEKTAWRTIRQANQQAKPGDTILVSPGRYFHSIIPQLSGQPGKRITYKRNGNGEVLIDGRGYYTPLALLLKKNHITIDGFIFTGMPLENNGTIIITNSNEVKILNCRVGHKKEKDTFFSINGTTCRNLLIEGNVFHGAASQLHVVNTPGLIVRNNTFAMPQPKIGAGGVNCVQVFNQPETVRITNNIFYGVGPRPSPQVAVYPGKDKGAVIFDYNLFFAGGKKKIIQVYGADCVTPVIPGATFEEWQTKSGQDANSIHADPLFVDVEAGDLRLKPNSPAIGAGENGTTIGGSEVAK